MSSTEEKPGNIGHESHDYPDEKPTTHEQSDSASIRTTSKHDGSPARVEDTNALQPTTTAAPSHVGDDINPMSIYTNWRFIMVFLAVSFGFCSSFLASFVRWNGALLALPIGSTIDPTLKILNSTVKPLYNDPSGVLASKDWPKVLSGINVSDIAAGVNTRRLIAGLDLPEISSGLNTSGILANTDVPTVLSGLNVSQIINGLNQPSIIKNGSSLSRRQSLSSLLSDVNLPNPSSLGLGSFNLTKFLSSNSGFNLSDAAMLAQQFSDVNATAAYEMGLPRLLSNANWTEMASGVNLTRIRSGLNMTGIMDNVDLPQVASGLDVLPILLSFNVTRMEPALKSLRNITSGLQLESEMGEVHTAITKVKQSQWVLPTLVSTQVLSSILFGRLSDYVGRRWVLIGGNCLALIGFLTVPRVSYGLKQAALTIFVGAGSGVQTLGPWLALAELVPVSHRFSVIGACLSLLSPLMAIHTAIAQAFIQNTAEAWRWPYYLNAIFTFVSLAGLFIAYHPPTYRQLHNHPTEDPPVKDWLGLFVLAGTAALLSFSLQWGLLIYNYASAQCILVITLSGVAMVAFIGYEFFFGDDHAAFPAYLVQSWNALSPLVLADAATLPMWLYPQLLTTIFLISVPEIGMHEAWDHLWSVGLAAGFIVGTVAMLRPKFLKWHASAAVTIQMTFIAAAACSSPTHHGSVMACFFMSSFGIGYVIVVCYTSALLPARQRDLGLVVGLVAGFRNLSYSVGRALIYSILWGHAWGRIQKVLIPHILIQLNYYNPLPDIVRAIRTTLTTSEPPPLTIKAISQKIMTSDYFAIIRVPFVKAQANYFYWIIGSNSVRYLLCLAIIYGIVTIVTSLLCADMDGFLSKKVRVVMNDGGIFRLPMQKEKPPKQHQV